MDTVERIFQLLDDHGMEQKKFAQLIGCPSSKISQWKTTGLKSYMKYLPKIAEVLDTTVQWLLTGEGDQKRQAATQKGSGLEEEFAKLFARMTPEDQNQIIAEMLKRQPDR